MYSVRARFRWQSLCMPQTSRQNRAARLSWRGSVAPLQIITPPPDTERHFKSTPPPPPPPRLSSSFISPVREEITVFFLTSSPFLARTHKTLLTQLPIHCPLTLHWPRQRIHFSKNRTNYPGLFVPPPPAIIYRSSSHCISDKYLHRSPIGAHVSCTVGMQDHLLATGYCGRGGGC